MFTIFGNFRISSPERLRRLSMCLRYLERVKPARWTFNIRGALKHEAAELLRSLPLHPLTVTHLESERGWCADTFELLKNDPSEFVVFVFEDHFFVSNPLLLENTIGEMHDRKLDYLTYSWFSQQKARERLAGIGYEEGEYTVAFELTPRTNVIFQTSPLGVSWLVSLASIVRTELLLRICASFKYERRRFDPMTPFDFERSYTDLDILPMRTAVPKMELFACIDDDSGSPASSLHTRGLHLQLDSRTALQRAEQHTAWGLEYGFIGFSVPKEISGRPDTALSFRTHKYLPAHQEISRDFSAIFVPHLMSMAFALKLDPSIAEVIDYESVAGFVSLFSLKVFDFKRCTYRSVSDHQALLAHENVFCNRTFAGFKAQYLEQAVTIGTPVADGGFKTYADYQTDEPRGNGTCLLYLNTVAPGIERLLEAVGADLASGKVTLVVVYGELHRDSAPSPALLKISDFLTRWGFSRAGVSDFGLSALPGAQPGEEARRRCAIYGRTAAPASPPPGLP